MEARRADAKQPARVPRPSETAGHHAAAGRGISTQARQGSITGDIEPGNGAAQAHVQHGGAVGTTSGHESGAAGEVPPGDNLRFETLSEEQEQRLLLVSPPYLRDMILFAINTGLRISDIFNLEWREVDI